MSSSVIAFFVIIFIPEAKHWISSYSLIALTEVSGGNLLSFWTISLMIVRNDSKFGHLRLLGFFFHLFITYIHIT